MQIEGLECVLNIRLQKQQEFSLVFCLDEAFSFFPSALAILSFVFLIAKFLAFACSLNLATNIFANQSAAREPSDIIELPWN